MNNMKSDKIGAMIEIRLPAGNWFYDPSHLLGPPGGFGFVYLGQSPLGQEVAVKQLRLEADAFAHRELRVADLLSGRQLEHIVPI